MDESSATAGMIRVTEELLKLVRELATITGRVLTYLDRKKDRRAAADLFGMAFTPGGMLDLLHGVADRSATSEDVTELARLLDDSTERVSSGVERLAGYIDSIREKLLFEKAMRLLMLMHRKKDIRRRIYLITNHLSQHNYSESMSESIVEETRSLIINIEELNNELAELHDQILSYQQRSSHNRPATKSTKVKKISQGKKP